MLQKSYLSWDASSCQSGRMYALEDLGEATQP